VATRLGTRPRSANPPFGALFGAEDIPPLCRTRGPLRGNRSANLDYPRSVTVSQTFSRASRERLTRRDLPRFPGETLFDRLGRAVCHAECLPRKELYEAWEMARRVRRQLRGGRVVDLGSGHGLLAQVLLLLDDSSPVAVAVDRALPQSHLRVHEVLAEAWPRLGGRVTFVAGGMDDCALTEADLVVSSHACGALTDHVLARAVAARACVAVLPCCHDLEACDAGDLAGWVDRPLAIDVVRATRLRAQGYRVWTQTIPATITPKNRLLLGAPASNVGEYSSG